MVTILEVIDFSNAFNAVDHDMLFLETLLFLKTVQIFQHLTCL